MGTSYIFCHLVVSRVGPDPDARVEVLVPHPALVVVVGRGVAAVVGAVQPVAGGVRLGVVEPGEALLGGQDPAVADDHAGAAGVNHLVYELVG